jgi:GNAT superfamily N-acetyltransferase
MVVSHYGKPVGVARVFPRSINDTNIEIPVAGIGGVYVTVDYRRQGVASMAVEALCARLRKDGAVAACLYSNDVYKHLYRQLNFIEVQPGFMIRALDSSLRFTPMEFPIATDVWRVDPVGHF